MNTRKKGSHYEHKAAIELEKAGYRILERNFSCKAGEIDIIARDGTYLVFVEVKYRTSAAAGSPLEAVDVRKQKKISRVAAFYLMSRHYADDTPVRFDVVAVLREDVQIIQNAFSYSFG